MAQKDNKPQKPDFTELEVVEKMALVIATILCVVTFAPWGKNMIKRIVGKDTPPKVAPVDTTKINRATVDTTTIFNHAQQKVR